MPGEISSGYVQTVLGPVAPEDLGITLPHEHLLLDLCGGRSREQVLEFLEADWVLSELTPEKGESLLSKWDEPIRLDNYSDVARHWMFYRAGLGPVTIDEAVGELEHFRMAGGDCVLDATPIGLGRNGSALREISMRAGVQVVMGTGFYVHRYHPPELKVLDEQGIYELLIRDITNGDGSECLPGVIGEIGTGWPVHPDEQRVLAAASRAQAETDLPLMIHPGRDPDAPLALLRLVEEAGGNLERTVMGHLDRTVFELSGLLEIARTGCYVAFDLFGRESSYYPQASFDLPNDAMRLNYMVGLSEAGHGSQLLLSQDLGLPPFLHKYGGFGYDNLLVNVVPLMRRKGFDSGQIQGFLVENPRRMLTVSRG